MREIDEKTVHAVLDDWRTAPVPERLGAALEFLEKVTLRAAELRPEDARRLLDFGIQPEAVRELLYVCFLFNTLDRLADAFDFEIPTGKGKRRIGALTLRLGYRVTRLLG